MLTYSSHRVAYRLFPIGAQLCFLNHDLTMDLIVYLSEMSVQPYNTFHMLWKTDSNLLTSLAISDLLYRI